MRHVYQKTLLYNRLLIHLGVIHDHDHWVRVEAKPVITFCMGKRHRFVHGEEAILSPPPLHQEGAIIIEGGPSVWGSDGVVISKIWMEGGGERAVIAGLMREQSVIK